MYRVEFHYWNSNNGYYCNETFDNLEEYCSAEEYFKVCESDSATFGSLIPEDPDEAINIEIYDEDNNLLSEFLGTKRRLNERKKIIMDIILKVGLEHKILELHCVNESCDTDYTLLATDKDGLEYSLVYSYDEDWYKYIEENPNDTYTGEAWIWLIKNSSPDYIGYRDKNDMWIEEDYVYTVEVKNTDVLW